MCVLCNHVMRYQWTDRNRTYDSSTNIGDSSVRVSIQEMSQGGVGFVSDKELQVSALVEWRFFLRLAKQAPVRAQA